MEYIFYFTLNKVVNSKKDIFLCVLAFFSSKKRILLRRRSLLFQSSLSSYNYNLKRLKKFLICTPNTVLVSEINQRFQR